MDYIDRIIRELIKKDYIDESLEEYKQFELFCNYLLITQENSIDLGQYCTPDSTEAVDSIAIKANNNYYSFSDFVHELKSDEKFEEITCIFIQAKTSTEFKRALILHFIDECIKIIEKLDLPASTLISIHCYFITKGTKMATLDSTYEQVIKKMQDSYLFGKTDFSMMGMKEIKNAYGNIVRKSNAEISLPQNISIELNNANIKEAYLAVISVKELKKLMDNSRYLFFENIRDFLGEQNRVNKQIAKTAEDYSDIFVLLNNGITIISDQLNSSRTGNKFYLQNYQIVNGCQTCRTLQMINNGKEDIQIPIKLIYTDDNSIKDKIIVSTNSQTGISPEQLLASTQYQKNLQEYFRLKNNDSSSTRIYYERRINEFPDEKRGNKIGIKETIKLFTAVYLERPHLASGYFTKAMKNANDRIFREGHKEVLYYALALQHKLFLEHLKQNKTLKTYNNARYHIHLIMRLLIEKNINTHLPTISNFTSRKAEEYGNMLISELKQSYIEYLNQSIEQIAQRITVTDMNDRDKKRVLYSAEWTEKIKQDIQHNATTKAKTIN